MAEISVTQAAARLELDASRIRQLLRSGALPGRRLGREWLVDGDAVAKLAAAPHRAGRPMSASRAWGLLDLLDGGNAAWLSPVARSQVKAQVRGMAGCGAARWRDGLRGRSDTHSVRVHPSALDRIAADASSGVLPAGAARAAAAGIDLVAVHPLVEVYLPARNWQQVKAQWHVRDGSTQPNLIVRLPRNGLWPFVAGEVGAATIAADLLDSPEPRAASAGAAKLNELARRLVSPESGAEAAR